MERRTFENEIAELIKRKAEGSYWDFKQEWETFDGDTVWLSAARMAELFQRDKSTISAHIKNFFQKVNSYPIQLLQNLQQLSLTEKYIRSNTTI